MMLIRAYATPPEFESFASEVDWRVTAHDLAVKWHGEGLGKRDGYEPPEKFD